MEGWMEMGFGFMRAFYIYITPVCLSETDSGGAAPCPSLVMAEMVLDS